VFRFAEYFLEQRVVWRRHRSNLETLCAARKKSTLNAAWVFLEF